MRRALVTDASVVVDLLARFGPRCGLYQPSLKREANTNRYVFDIVSGFVAVSPHVPEAENASNMQATA